MIIRKPYAFLIKYFKIIHIALFILSTILLFKLRSIYLFFKDYVIKDVYTYIEGMASNYIGYFIFFVVIIIIVSTIMIFYLMKEKEKPVLFYRLFIIYSVLILLVLFVYYDFFDSLEFKSYQRDVLSIYRDFIGFFYLLDYIFVGFTFVRGFGFDIKKFSFEKDIKALNISENDNEEIELGTSFDKDKILNAIRKERRMAIYFFKENAVTLLIILGVILIVTGYLLYDNVIEEKIVYSAKDKIVSNDLEYSINNTYLTKYSIDNKNLEQSYIIVNFKVRNKDKKDKKINLQNTRLNIKDKYYYPITNSYSYFLDLGNPYYNNIIEHSKSDEYILVFRIGSTIDIDSKVYLDLYDSNERKNSEDLVKYKRVLLPINYLDNSSVDFELKIGDEINFNNNYLKNGNISFIKYTIGKNFVYEYEECIKDVCNKYKKPLNSIKNSIIKIDYNSKDLDLDVVKNYFILNYGDKVSEKIVINDEIKYLYNDDNSVYYEVPNNIEKAKNIDLYIKMRNIVYRINLLNEQ